MYVKGNFEEGSCKRCCGKQRFERVFVNLCVQHELHMGHIFICSLPCSISFIL